MNIKELKYFHELVKNKNFSDVATHFEVSQPTITMAIRRLEESFDAKLFTRDQGRHQLSVTLAGQQLDEHVQAILEHLEIAQNSLSQLATSRLVLGLPPIMTKHFFAKLAHNLTEQNQLKNIVPVQKGSTELRKMLKAGTLDLSFLSSIEPGSEPDIMYHNFGHDNFVLLVGPESPYFKQDKIWFSDLKNEKFITFNQSFVHAEALKRFSQHANIRPNIVFQSNDAQIISEMVANNVGVSLLANAAIIPRSDLHIVHFYDENQPIIHWYLAQRMDRILSPQQQTIVDILLNNS